ncbi:MAG: hypothetical protein GWO08_14870, partial [Gammaproteobacteria bacterium]|nr:hypothetical protein [candidate division Zixibacteria bacterium]NIR94893.1 hypothetical protein [Gammaproteobacteria bacterium]NIS47531.1 hypothetical protein [candidate division Zixibacteria bacterium]NIU15628.1 hypothetical protein [candidate division Zixibacteria bacterium]NIV07773.1 hypothetical protein [candidate division Zixibacteria bacterium]
MSFQIAHIDKNKKTQEMFRLHLASLFPLTVFENPLAFLESFENERFPLVFSRSDLQPIN